MGVEKMSKADELKQDVEEYGLIYADRETKQKKGEYSYSQIVQAYERGALDFAEPREKRIAELEQKIDKLEHELKAEQDMRQYWHDEYCKVIDNANFEITKGVSN